MKRVVGFSGAVCGLCASLMTSEAKAQTCGGNGPCISTTNTGSGDTIEAYGNTTSWVVEVNNKGNGIGVIGVSGDVGVEGDGTTGVTGHGGGSGNGVVGLVGSAKTISAYSGSGVYGASDTNAGVVGTSTAHTGIGVYGEGTTYGVYGHATGTLPVPYAVYANGNLAYTGSIINVSDERLKMDISTLSGSLERLLRLRGVSFRWKEPAEHGNNTGVQRGFIAQEYEKVFPEWVKTGPDGFKTIETAGLHAIEVESIRTLNTENDLLKQRVAALESGRQPRISGFNLNGVGFGVGGLGLGLGLVISHRKREQPASQR